MTTLPCPPASHFAASYVPTVDVAASGAYTVLAVQLNAAMAGNWGLRHRYLCTYGTPWVPLPTGDAQLAAGTAPTLDADRAARAALPTVRR